MTRKRQDTKTHRCALPEEPDDILIPLIETGAFVYLRRKFKRITMISSQHPQTRYYVHSLMSLRIEQRRHLIHHYHMIHPFSMFTFWWRIVTSLNLCFIYFVWPSAQPYLSDDFIFKMFAGPNSKDSFTNTASQLRIVADPPVVLDCLAMIYIAMMVTTFFTGYYNEATHRVTLNPRMIFVRYLLSNLVFDVIAIIPFCYHLLKSFNGIRDALTIRSDKLRFMMYFLTLFKFCRYSYVMKTFDQVRLYFGINRYVHRAIKLFVYFILSLLLFNTLLYIFMFLYPDIDRTYIECLQSSMAILLLVNHGYKPSELLIDRIYPIVFILFGFTLHLFLFVNVMQLWFQYYSTESKQRSIYKSVGAFVRYKALPVRMRKRIFLYMEYKYERQFYRDSIIKQITTTFLQEEVLTTVSKEIADKVDFFQNIPEKLMRKLRKCFINEIYLPGDIIIKAGSVGKCMFFILAGTVVVKTAEGREVCFLRDGDHFGEIALVSNSRRVATVSAVSPTEVFKLSKKDFLYVLSQSADLMKVVSDNMIQRVASAHNELFSAGGGETVSTYSLQQRSEEQDFLLVGEDQEDGDD